MAQFEAVYVPLNPSRKPRYWHITANISTKVLKEAKDHCPTDYYLDSIYASQGEIVWATRWTKAAAKYF